MRQTLLFIICAILLFTAVGNVQAVEDKKKNTQSSSSKLLHGEVDIVASSCADAGVTLSSLKVPAIIEKVRLGSPALYAGIAQGDKVLSLQISDNKLCLLIERNGQRFYAQLKTSAQAEKPLLGRASDTTLKAAAIDTQTINRQRAALRNLFLNHDLSLIIDRSGSMIRPDCSDYPNYISRWQWCSKQSTDLAQIAASAASSITMTFFNNTYDVWQNVAPQNIPNLFARYVPAGTTLLAAPLQDQLKDYFISKRIKPLIIVIISDGMPQDSPTVASVLQQASKQIKYLGEVTVVFLLIGTDTNDSLLRAKLGELNGGSIKNGGIFDVIPFLSISSKGFRQALLEELIIVQSAVDTSKSSKAGQFATENSIKH